MSMKQEARLCFDCEFDEEVAAETADRGYWGHSHVELANGVTRPAVFYDAVDFNKIWKRNQLKASHLLQKRD